MKGIFIANPRDVDRAVFFFSWSYGSKSSRGKDD